jgi:hypothetical protein
VSGSNVRYPAPVGTHAACHSRIGRNRRSRNPHSRAPCQIPHCVAPTRGAVRKPLCRPARRPGRHGGDPPISTFEDLSRWRDPDSNRGHHDFQTTERRFRTGQKRLHTSRFRAARISRTKFANCIDLSDNAGHESPSVARSIDDPRLAATHALTTNANLSYRGRRSRAECP